MCVQVEPVAWRAEAERLAPQLARLHLPPGAAAGVDQEWLARWQSTCQLQQQLGGIAQQLQAGLPAMQQRVGDDLQRLLQAEQRINQEMAGPMGELGWAAKHSA